jgi:hypothetical protein
MAADFSGMCGLPSGEPPSGACGDPGAGSFFGENLSCSGRFFHSYGLFPREVIVTDERLKVDAGRRAAMRWIAAAAPAAMLAGAIPAASEETDASKAEAKPPTPKLSDDAKCVVRNTDGLTGPERKRLEKQLPGFEGALKKLRDFDLPDDVEPATTFRALRSTGGRR